MKLRGVGGSTSSVHMSQIKTDGFPYGIRVTLPLKLIAWHLKLTKVPTLQNDSQEHDDLWNKNHTSIIITTIIKVPPLQNESQEHDDNSDFKNDLCLLKCFKGWWGQWKLKSHNCITSSFARIVIEGSKLKMIQIVMVVILTLTIVVMKGGGFYDLQNENQNHHHKHHHHHHHHYHHHHHHPKHCEHDLRNENSNHNPPSWARTQPTHVNTLRRRLTPSLVMRRRRKIQKYF